MSLLIREIKFRGIPLFGKEFVYGSLIIDTDEKGEKVYVIRRIESGKVSNFEVKEETVGQFIGLQDKNLEDIYEGDIIKDSSNRIMIVEWDNRIGASRFIFKTINEIGHIQAGRYLNTHEWITSGENDVEIIRNICKTLS